MKIKDRLIQFGTNYFEYKLSVWGPKFEIDLEIRSAHDRILGYGRSSHIENPDLWTFEGTSNLNLTTQIGSDDYNFYFIQDLDRIWGEWNKLRIAYSSNQISMVI